MSEEYVLDAETVETHAGEYRIEWVAEEYAEQPYDCGFGMVWIDHDHRYLDKAIGKHADDIRSIVAYSSRRSAYEGNIYDTEVRSSAALARYLRLKYGLRGLVAIDAVFDWVELSADRSSVGARRDPFYGFAWEDPEVTGNTDEATCRANVEIGLAQWRAWRDGDVFGWRVIGPHGNEVAAVWGYYGLDAEREYTRGEAIEAINADVTDRTDAVNLVGSGFVGLI